MAKIALVSCVSSKLPRAAEAKDLYISPLFTKSRHYAEINADRWYILSAKYGLVAPERIIEPYEKTLNTMPREERKEWSRRVLAQLTNSITLSDQIIFLAGERYREDLERELISRGYSVSTPMRGLSIGKQLQWLTRHARSTTKSELEEFYRILDNLSTVLDGGRILNTCSGKNKWPERGVYILYEPGETRTRSILLPRVVRIGTHMVSCGSKATLWNRLRTHRGHENGIGNHRASVFRRHIGEAILNREQGKLSVPTWGKGQSATREVQEAEADLERIVSEYIGRMTVLWLDIADPAGPDSDRAFIERNAIALLASVGRKAYPPSSTWLGNFSPTSAITSTGLWNVDHTDYRYDNRFLSIFASYVDITAGRRPRLDGPLAPRDWFLADKGRIGRGQMFLFSDEEG